MATARDSAFYTSQSTNKYLQQPASQHRQRPIGIPFELTAVATAAVDDTYNLGVIKAGERVVGLSESHTAHGAGALLSIGDAGSAVRFLNVLDVAAAGQSGVLAAAGQGFTPTADTVFIAKFTGAAPTVAGTVKGVLWVLPAL